MEENTEVSIRDAIARVTELYNSADFLSLINYSKTNEVQKIVLSLKDYKNYVRKYDILIPSIQALILVGIANYTLKKYNCATEYFRCALEAFEKIEQLSYFFNIFCLNELYKAFNHIEKNNLFLKPILYAYIAQSYFKIHNPLAAACNYRKAVKHIDKLSLNHKEHKNYYIDILLGRSDSYYELTKIFITSIKIIFFIVCSIFCIIYFFDKINAVYSGLFRFFPSYFIYSFMIIACLTLPKVFYKIFYFLLRKIRRFISLNFIMLFPEPFREMLKNLLNWINLKKILSYKTHKKAIEQIEETSTQDFNTFFAIAKLYYCLGEYKNSAFYIQKALTYHKEDNKPELAMAYHYLARIAYKTSNHLTAIDFYNKTIENLMCVNANDEEYKIEYLPSIADMIKYTQENRDKIEQTTFSRTYLPLILTLILTIVVCMAQIYYCISEKQKEAIFMFNKMQKYYSKIIK